MIDTHAHVYLPEFLQDQQVMIERARQAGVEKIYMPNIDRDSVEAMLSVAERDPFCLPMIGLHPCSVTKDFTRDLYELESWLARHSFAAIGEMGTDLYWDKTFWPQQQEAFRVQVGWASQHRLPLVIHCRASLDETLALLEPLQDGTLRGVFHCFTGTAEQAQRAIALGFYLGIGGVLTFKNAGLDRVAAELPLEKLVLETDSPYLAPVPHRGKRNEPAFLSLIAARLSEIKNVPLQQVEAVTTQNANNLFWVET